MGRALHAQGTRDPVFTPGAPGAVGRALNVQGTRDPVFTLGAPGAVGRALHAQGTRDPVFTPGAPGAVGRALHAQRTRDPVFTPGAPGAVGRGCMRRAPGTLCSPRGLQRQWAGRGPLAPCDKWGSAIQVSSGPSLLRTCHGSRHWSKASVLLWLQAWGDRSRRPVF